MALAVVLSIIAGVFGVWQAGINKVVADHLGFTASLMFNGVFFLVFNALFFLFVWMKPETLPQEFAIRLAFHEMRWWWIIPGLMGFTLVMGLAVSVGRIGAVQTIIISIAAQVFASILWDIYQGEFALTKWRLIGAGITLMGAVLTTLS